VLRHIHQKSGDNIIQVMPKGEFIALPPTSKLQELCPTKARTMNTRKSKVFAVNVGFTDIVFDDVETDPMILTKSA
jgi:hypothetical protein